jgi:hypothetical protein
MNKTNPTNKSLQSIPDPNNEREQSRAQKQKARNLEHRAAREALRYRELVQLQPQNPPEGAHHGPPGKSRPSSAITNYTSGQSGVRSKMNAKRLQQSSNQRLPGK